MLGFADTEAIPGFPVDHPFLAYKKEANEFAFEVGKISVKEQEVSFIKI